jgi:hypothetical protein
MSHILASPPAVVGLPLVDRLPPRILSCASTREDLDEAAREFEHFIVKHRRNPTLEGAVEAAMVRSAHWSLSGANHFETALIVLAAVL